MFAFFIRNTITNKNVSYSSARRGFVEVYPDYYEIDLNGNILIDERGKQRKSEREFEDEAIKRLIKKHLIKKHNEKKNEEIKLRDKLISGGAREVEEEELDRFKKMNNLFG